VETTTPGQVALICKGTAPDEKAYLGAKLKLGHAVVLDRSPHIWLVRPVDTIGDGGVFQLVTSIDQFEYLAHDPSSQYAYLTTDRDDPHTYWTLGAV
jgi:hypothetical protein